jgi:chromosome segregation ATPase
MPFLAASTMSEQPPRISDKQKAMEAAVAAERTRAKQLEAQEVDLSADELRHILKQERHRMSGMARTIAELKSTAVQCQSEAEIHEEGRINSLLGKLERMQIEKGRIINELEREEEMLTNTLQKKLDTVRQEKLALEKQIEREQRSHSNLQSKLTDLREATSPKDTPKTTTMTTTTTATRHSTNNHDKDNNDDEFAGGMSPKDTEALRPILPPLHSLSEGDSEDEDEDYVYGEDEPAIDI